MKSLGRTLSRERCWEICKGVSKPKGPKAKGCEFDKISGKCSATTKRVVRGKPGEFNQRCLVLRKLKKYGR